MKRINRVLRVLMVAMQDARGQVPDIREDYKTFTESFC